MGFGGDNSTRSLYLPGHCSYPALLLLPKDCQRGSDVRGEAAISFGHHLQSESVQASLIDDYRLRWRTSLSNG